METPTQPLHPKLVAKTPGDELSLSTALWAIAGFVVFAVVIFLLVIYSPL
jgi:disulfide bond formation protein DsbB